MLPFCPVNQSVENPWENNGLTPCFTGLLSSCLISVFIIPLILRFFFLKKCGLPVYRETRRNAKIWYAQIFFSALSPFLTCLVPLSFALSTVEKITVNGYLILLLIVIPLSWILSIITLYCECSYVLFTERRKRHSLVLLLFWSCAFISSLLPLVSVRSTDWWWKLQDVKDITAFSFWLLEVLILLIVVLLGILAPGLPSNFSDVYDRLGSTTSPQTEGRWARRYKHLKFICPYIWPQRNRLVQLKVLICVGLLIAERVTNLYSPILYKRIVDSLTISENQTLSTNIPAGLAYVNLHAGWFHHIVDRLVGSNGLVYRWDYVLQFIVVRFLQGLGGFGGGLLGALRSQLWIQVEQFSTRELSIMLFAHLHSLSLQWHLSRKTGEVLRVVDRGTTSISSVLSYAVFNVLPAIVDIVISVVYFVAIFNAWYGLLVFSTMALYMGLTIVFTEKRAKYRREMNALDNQKGTKAVDALLNFETVKYFNAEQFEVFRFKEAFVKYQKAEWITSTSLNLLNTVQGLIITIGLLIGTLLCARDVVQARLTVGDFVLFYSYILQLYSPLGFFGTYYRLIQTNVIDMENMFDLLEQNPDVVDQPNAPDLRIFGGEIEFRNVHFHYVEERPILKNISFKVPAGRTVALVGQSGAGKSTIVRLLFRFYDVTQGEIQIDGQDIRNVTQSSLRRAIGVVPQDTVLFNDTIQYNIRYGRQTANASDVEQAAVSADIHGRIMEFPQRYETVVGERGLKLSGGEKQRVAIARNILKDPRILMLDEATSALDTTTERTIQASLSKIAQNRTTLVVAHRLSTIVHADEILMMHQGEIIERGTHTQLLAIPGGRYAALWRAQVEDHISDDTNV